jgi:mono/diheme cytochrome c family protein
MSARFMMMAVVVVVGCADDGIERDPAVAGDTAPPTDDAVSVEVTYADVAPILAANCTGCHSDPPSGGAPFSLADYDAASARSGRIVARAVDASPGPMPPGGTVLSDAEAALLVEWEEAGAPE